MELKFSVIIPVFKAELYLEKSIESVLKQSYSNYELIIIDDGSPDKCPQICDSYKGNPKVIVRHQKNQGVSASRNNGVSVATGDILCFLDADDEWDKTMLQELNHIYMQNPEIGSVFTGRSDMLTSGEKKDFKFNIEKKYLKIDDLFPVFGKCRTSFYSMRKSLFLSIGGFDVFAKRGEDVDIMVKAFSLSPMGYVNVILGIYRVGTPFNSDNVRVDDYYPFEKLYKCDYPVKSSLVVHITGLVMLRALLYIKTHKYVKACRLLLEIPFPLYLYYKIKERLSKTKPVESYVHKI